MDFLENDKYGIGTVKINTYSLNNNNFDGANGLKSNFPALGSPVSVTATSNYSISNPSQNMIQSPTNTYAYNNLASESY